MNKFIPKILALLFLSSTITTRPFSLPLWAARVVSLAAGTAAAVGLHKINLCKFPYVNYKDLTDDDWWQKKNNGNLYKDYTKSNWWGKGEGDASVSLHRGTIYVDPDLQHAYVIPLGDAKDKDSSELGKDDHGIFWNWPNTWGILGVLGGTYVLYEFLYWKTPEGKLKWAQNNIKHADQSPFSLRVYRTEHELHEAVKSHFITSDLYLAEAYNDFQIRSEKATTAIKKLNEAMKEGSSSLAQEAQDLLPQAQRAEKHLASAITHLRKHEHFEKQLATWKMVKAQEKLAEAQRESKINFVYAL